MKMYRSQKILLHPTSKQIALFAGAAGLSRFSWNWAVGLRSRYYRIFKKTVTSFALAKHWNKVKSRRFCWASKYSKLVPEYSFRSLDRAYRAAFDRLGKNKNPGFPKFQKKGVNESFQVVPSNHFPLRRFGNRFFIPKIGQVKCVTPIRWPDGMQVQGRIKKRAGRWWLILSYELPTTQLLPTQRPSCGVDLGCKALATISSNGTIATYPSLKPYAKATRRLKRMSRVASRRMKNSNKRRKAATALAKVYDRVSNLRENHLHQLTSRLTKTFGVIVLEDFKITNLMRRNIRATIQDQGFGELRRQIEYKSAATGTRVFFANRFFPSSKKCSRCQVVKDELPLSARTFHCEGCGLVIDRDENAAINLEALGQSMPESTPVEIGDQGRRKASQCRSKKRECKQTVTV